jgi:hypothetical protein
VASSQTTADFLTATLAAHGIHASHHAYTHAYPSVAWAQGFRVTVATADAAEARAVLAALSGRDDVAVLGEGDPRPDGG